MLEVLLRDWQDCGGNRQLLFEQLKAAFTEALGPDFDISAYERLGCGDDLYDYWIRPNKLQETQSRTNFKRRGMAELRAAWCDTQLIYPRAHETVLSFVGKIPG